MSIFRFSGDSLIDELTVRHTEGGGVRAYLHGRDGADQGSLDAIKRGLAEHALQWTPVTENGKPALEVRGFGKHEETLLHTLRIIGATTHNETREATPDDKSTLWARFKRNTLRASGFGYFVGDAGFLKYSLKEAFTVVNGKKKLTNPQGLAAGILYALGSPIIAFFGHSDKSDIQLKHLSYNMLNELEDKKVEVPKDASIRAVANGHNATIGKKIRTFMERYPAEITNTLFGLAGGMIMWEKIKHLKTFNWKPVQDFRDGGWKKVMEIAKMKQKIPGQTAHSRLSVLMDIGLGSMSVIAGLISLFIEEEVPDPRAEKKTGIMGLLQQVKRRPLAAASAFLGIATGAHGISTYVDWKDVKKDLAPGNPHNLTVEQLKAAQDLKAVIPGRALFVGANLAAEALMAVSSKGHGKGVKSDDSLERSSYAIAADLIQRTAPEKREALLGTITEFLSHKKHLAGDPAAIRQGIKEQIATLDNNPWINSGSVAASSIQNMPDENAGLQKGMRWQNHAVASRQLAPAIHGV